MTTVASAMQDGSDQADLTQLLGRCDGDPEALAEVVTQVYAELRRVASRVLRSAGPDCTLDPTALVHEAYVALVDQENQAWENRSHFFAIAARLIRRVLLRHEERRRALKRGGGGRAITLVEIADEEGVHHIDLLALDAVLQKLQEMDEFKHRVVQLKFFGGLKVEEIAELEGISERTVRRAWSFSRAWIAKELATD